MTCIIWGNGEFDNTEKTAEVFCQFHKYTLTLLDSDSTNLYIAYSSLLFEDLDDKEKISIE